MFFRSSLVACVLVLAVTFYGCGPVTSLPDGGSSMEDDAGTGGGGGGGGGEMDSGVDAGEVDAGLDCMVSACVAPSGPCVEAFCDTNGACAERALADGLVLPTQLAGDCRKAVCLAGQSNSQVDDADLPDDSNTCTDDLCTAGVPSNAARAVSSTCGPAGASFCDGNGSCVECLGPTDCGGPQTECAAPSCTAGVCGTTLQPAGTVVGMQIAGDCRRRECSGVGPAVVLAPDATDIQDDSNSCTTDTCQATTPAHAPVPQGTGCSVAGVCNGTGQCVGCVVPADCQAPSGSCEVSTCTAGTCGIAPKIDGIPCDDGNSCSQTDSCQAGACVGSNPVTCSQLDQCHVGGICNATTGSCSNPNTADGLACSDGDACTQADTCQTGTCTGASPVSCAALDQCHSTGTCNSATGLCSNPNKADGTACNDGSACTQSDTCQAGTCNGASAVTCAALDQCHFSGTCNPATGVCSNPSKANGSACSDGDACSQTDTCQAGACSGANPFTCGALDQCHIAGSCNTGTGVCSNPNKADGSACVLAALPGTCSSGACAICGNGTIEGGEQCDDNNTTACDGCSPKCELDTTLTSATAAGLNAAIVDNGYNGTLASMTCVNVTVASQATGLVEHVCPTLAINHTWVGDLVVKLISPANTVVTLMSMPGVLEPTDNGAAASSENSNLAAGFPITWKTGGPSSAETMGNTLANSGVVCRDDLRCVYDPNSGAAAAGTLSAFIGQSAAGTWKLCVGDSGLGDVGAIDQVKLVIGQ